MRYWLDLFSTGYTQADKVTGQQLRAITAEQSAQIVSLLSAGTFFGALGSAPFAGELTVYATSMEQDVIAHIS